jgi:hypothetical protein
MNSHLSEDCRNGWVVYSLDVILIVASTDVPEYRMVSVQGLIPVGFRVKNIDVVDFAGV